MDFGWAILLCLHPAIRIEAAPWNILRLAICKVASMIRKMILQASNGVASASKNIRQL